MTDAESAEQAWVRYLGRAADSAMSGPELSRGEKAALVRHTLAILEEQHPGRSVEVRVAPFGAVQILEGATHRRGTPPAVVEMDADTWLALASGRTDWETAEGQGRIDASGERSDLSGYLPI